MLFRPWIVLAAKQKLLSAREQSPVADCSGYWTFVRRRCPEKVAPVARKRAKNTPFNVRQTVCTWSNERIRRFDRTCYARHFYRVRSKPLPSRV